MPFKLPRIYPITDKSLAGRTSHLSILKDLVRGGAQLVQIRDKSTPLPGLYSDLMKCAEFAEAQGVTLIVNDRCDLVLSCGASGVHLGQEDLPPHVARSILGRRRIIGLSAHSVSQIRRSLKLPIQYLGFGPVYPTRTKSDAAPAVGLRGLKTACRLSTLPVVAIGGIGLGQVQEVLNAGAASAAVISALMTAKNIAREMDRFLKAATERQ
jgi:thiamine-phosphate pyrophosphorylase